MYLLDTDVLSALRRGRERVVREWAGRRSPSEVFISVVSIGEIERGIELQRKRNPGFARDLEAWINTTIRTYGERVLPMSAPIARRWGCLAAQLGNRNPDLIIAATALEHGLTFVTRNVSDFEPTGVTIFDPFTATDHT